MNIETLRQLVLAKRYQIKIHAVQHALQEGFSEKEIIATVMAGSIIEQYPDRNRVLICGAVLFNVGTEMYLHVVCEQNYADQVELVTAYVPDRREWGTPPVKRRQKRK